jgi:hypothetical protein
MTYLPAASAVAGAKMLYTTRPGSRLLVPALCFPTGEMPPPQKRDAGHGRGAMMPLRRRTRAQDVPQRIMAERRLD